jgi:hypothetical protein
MACPWSHAATARRRTSRSLLCCAAQYDNLAYYMLNMHADPTKTERTRRLAEDYLANRQRLVDCLTRHATVRPFLRPE